MIRCFSGLKMEDGTSKRLLSQQKDGKPNRKLDIESSSAENEPK